MSISIHFHILALVSTPIGNLEDITHRAVRVLREADFIICEDTRVSSKLLHHYDIHQELVSFHAQSDQRKIDSILERLHTGCDGALISDAGTPGISDPGYRLIQACIQSGIQLVPIPGPSAFLSGLVASGMHTHHFLYLGFLPIKKGRMTLLKQLSTKTYTVVIYESPHRILRTLHDISLTFGSDHGICVAREITKIHETFYRGPVGDILTGFEAQLPKGEMVVIF